MAIWICLFFVAVSPSPPADLHQLFQEDGKWDVILGF